VLCHAFGAAFDNHDLMVGCVVGDGGAETEPLGTSWHSNKFLHTLTDGGVLPILHLNGYKIANPAVLARISIEEVDQLFRGYGWKLYLMADDYPMEMHQKMAQLMDKVIEEVKAIKKNAVENNDAERPIWPMIILKSPKGWTGQNMSMV
jgi:xylulose-5-phosphate/fructose-6-phosphate phosphoketolase